MMTGIKVKKAALRRDLLNRRRRLSAWEIDNISRTITERLVHLTAYRNAGTVHCYLTKQGDSEISTDALTDRILEDGKRLVVPRMTRDQGRLEHVAITGKSGLKVNAWGIPEPGENEPLYDGNPDLIIVPMVGGDRHGNRLGYGKGFYDRFLGQSRAFKAGLLPACCLVGKLPAENHDIRLDCIITEEEVIGTEGS